jgi:acyl-ACP thioesterase
VTVPLRIDQPFRIRFDECTPDGTLRSSSFLRHAQDVGWVHSDLAGFDRSWYRSRGLTWLVRAVEVDIVEPIGYSETLRVSTEVAGFRRVWGRRRSEAHGDNDERIRAVMIIDWVMVGPTGAPIRIPSEIADALATEVGTFTPIRVERVEPPADAAVHTFSVRPQELDPMGHVNNAAYLDYVEEALARAGHADETTRYPRRYRLEYVASAEPDAELVGTLWEDELGWSYQLRTADGRELLRARVETDPSAWVGG